MPISGFERGTFKILDGRRVTAGCRYRELNHSNPGAVVRHRKKAAKCEVKQAVNEPSAPRKALAGPAGKRLCSTATHGSAVTKS